MSKQIPDETREEIMRLYDNGKGLSPAEIARHTGVSYSSAYGMTKVRQMVNPETGQLFESLSQYNEYRVRQMVNPETGQLFESLSQYKEYRVRQMVNPETGQLFESRSQYKEYRARQMVNPETGQLFESRSQLMDYRARQRVSRPENQGLSDLIQRRLKKLRKNQSWLSRQIGVSREAVSKYVQGKYIPDKGVLEKLYSALEVPYQTLDDLLENPFEE